jgi:NAD(P)-dependent dehydrogenase (short-subunit alcohol dehydrogenase family)
MSPLKRRGARWTEADIPDKHGRTAVITGANTGLGFETARALAERGAAVVLACRDLAKAEAAASRIRAVAPQAPVSVVHLDLGSLDSVRAAAGQIGADHERLDLLINNAGLMMPPYGRTADGFELQFGTNHLGHFALTGLLLDRLLAAPGSRVVTISSVGHRAGDIRFDDLQFRRRYRRIPAYGQSKLANLMFTYELQRRLATAGAPTIALAAHPGIVPTELQRYLPSWMNAFGSVMPHQPAALGAGPALRAATDPAASGGEYYGPSGFGELSGFPVLVASSARSHDIHAQYRLWEHSEQLTGIIYQFSGQSSQRTS